MKTAILDYGTGNIHSLAKQLEQVGAHVVIETDPVRALTAKAVVFPGLGSYGPAASVIVEFAPAIRAALASGQPCLAIGVGMHLLFEHSQEGEGNGVAALPGSVRRLHTRRTPHVGWNDVAITNDPIFEGLEDFLAYFSNGTVALPADESHVLSWAEHEDVRFPAVVRRDQTWGVQFRPEKSGPAGVALLRNFVAIARR